MLTLQAWISIEGNNLDRKGPLHLELCHKCTPMQDIKQPEHERSGQKWNDATEQKWTEMEWFSFQRNRNDCPFRRTMININHSSSERTIISVPLKGVFRDRRQKSFGFLSRHCLERGGGGQAKSAKNCKFPDESLLFQTGLTTPQWLQNSKMNPQDCPSACWIVTLMQTFALGNKRTGPKRTGQKPKSQPAGNQS